MHYCPCQEKSDIQGNLGNVGKAKGAEKKVVIKSDELFLATGRLAFTDGLNLGAAGIKFDEGSIKVGKRCRTNVRRIFACGDVTGVMQASYAVHQADVVLSNLLNVPKFVNFKKIPCVLHIDPEVAMIGRTEKDVSEKKSIRTVRIDIKNIDVSKFKDDKGFLKLILNRSKIIGVVLACRNASAFINNYTLAIGKNIKVLKKISFPVPSLAQINSLALEKYMKKSGNFKNMFLRLIGRI